jgi:hypothetical protein
MPQNSSLAPKATHDFKANTEVKITNSSHDGGSIRVVVTGSHPPTTTDNTIPANDSINLIAQAAFTITNIGTVTLELSWD